MNRTQDELTELRRKARQWKPGGLTTAELQRLAAALEATLAALPGDSSAAVILRSELDEAAAELDERAAGRAR